jgi:hypothetical protein
MAIVPAYGRSSWNMLLDLAKNQAVSMIVSTRTPSPKDGHHASFQRFGTVASHHVQLPPYSGHNVCVLALEMLQLPCISLEAADDIVAKAAGSIDAIGSLASFAFTQASVRGLVAEAAEQLATFGSLKDLLDAHVSIISSLGRQSYVAVLNVLAVTVVESNPDVSLEFLRAILRATDSSLTNCLDVLQWLSSVRICFQVGHDQATFEHDRFSYSDSSGGSQTFFRVCNHRLFRCFHHGLAQSIATSCLEPRVCLQAYIRHNPAT